MSTPTNTQSPIYGYLAEFDDKDALFACAKAARARGFTDIEAYTPTPLHGLPEILGYKNYVPHLVFLGGLAGVMTGFGLCYWVSVLEYPLNIGGKPFNSWQAFVVPTFETMILFSALTAVFGMLVLNGFPQPYHPVFNVEKFSRCSSDRFFFIVLSRDKKFDLVETRRFLADQHALSVDEVPH